MIGPLTLTTAHLMDTVGNDTALTQIAAINVAAPAQKFVDRAIQQHRGGRCHRRLPAYDGLPVESAPASSPATGTLAHCSLQKITIKLAAQKSIAGTHAPDTGGARDCPFITLNPRATVSELLIRIKETTSPPQPATSTS
jgi:hypothetical protein